jgi:hypothetical protein
VELSTVLAAQRSGNARAASSGPTTLPTRHGRRIISSSSSTKKKIAFPKDQISKIDCTQLYYIDTVATKA